MASGTVRFRTASGGAVAAGRRLAAGGQGEVFAVSAEQVFKRYFPATLERDPSLERRLRAIAGHAPHGWREPDGHLALAWPAEVVLADGAFTGFLMPAVDMAQTVGLHRITNPTDRQAATGAAAWARAFTWDYLVRTAANLARATHALHQAGVVIGDFNEANVRVWREARVTLLDCDSMQVTDPVTGERFFCPVGRPEFTPPELLHADWHTTVRHPSSDLFALAIHVHQLLLEGEHPFRGLWHGAGDKPPVPELARLGTWTQRADGPLTPRPAAISPALLPPAITGMFRRAFEDGAVDPGARPAATEWRDALTALAAQLRHCATNRAHVYPAVHHTCPWCRHAAARTPAPAPRRVPRPQAPAPVTVRSGGFPAAASVTTPALVGVSAPAPAAPAPAAPAPAVRARRSRRSALQIALWIVVPAVALIGLVISLPGQGPLPELSEPSRTLAAPGQAHAVAAAFGGDGTTLATADSSAVYLENTATGQVGTTVAKGVAAGVTVALSPDGTVLATSGAAAASGAADHVPQVALWDLATRRPVGTFPLALRTPVTAMAFSPDGKTLALGARDGTIELWSVAGRRLIATITDTPTFTGRGFAVNALTFSPEGKTLAAAHSDGTVSVWDVATRSRASGGCGLLDSADIDGAYSVAFSPDGRLLAVSNGLGSVEVCDQVTGVLSNFNTSNAGRGEVQSTEASAVTFSADGTMLAAGYPDSLAYVWDVASPHLVATVDDPGGRGILALAFSRNGTALATADADGSTYVWDTSLWQPGNHTP